MPPTNISIAINLAALTTRLQLAVQKAMNLVAVGLHAGKSVAQYPLVLPDTAFFHQFATNEQWTTQHTTKEWQRWVLVNGFRDVSEVISSFLEEVQSILACWSLITLQRQRGRLTGADWHEAIVLKVRRFHRLGLPDKFGFLQRDYGFDPDPGLAGNRSPG